MGRCPDWYLLLRAADRLHAPAWEVLARSVYWRDIGLKALSAELGAQKERAQHGAW